MATPAQLDDHLHLDAERHRRPPAFTSAFDKARKSYGLVSGLLLAWALVGVTLQHEPFPGVRARLESPHAAPYLLIALILYFAFRFEIEWWQSEETRRRLRASVIDRIAAHTIGALAVIVFVTQKAFQLQIADVWRSSDSLAVGLGVVTVGWLNDFKTELDRAEWKRGQLLKRRAGRLVVMLLVFGVTMLSPTTRQEVLASPVRFAALFSGSCAVFVSAMIVATKLGERPGAFGAGDRV